MAVAPRTRRAAASAFYARTRTQLFSSRAATSAVSCGETRSRLSVDMTPEQQAETNAAFRDHIRELTDLKPEDFVRAEELGKELAFSSARPEIEAVIGLARELSRYDVSRLPARMVNSGFAASRNLAQAFTALRLYTPDFGPGSNPRTGRDMALSKFEQAAGEFVDSAALITSFAAATQSANKDAEIRTLVAEIAKLRDEARAALNDVLDLRNTVRDSAADVGTARHAILFQQEAAKHQRASYGWLVVTVLLAVITGVAAWRNYLMVMSASPSLTPAATVQSVVAKLILFSLLLTATIWSGRIYRAHRHNAVVNRHRQNALSSFETFAGASQDAQTKDAVLLQATQCIFSQQQSGYLPSEPESTGTPQLVELIRTIVPTK